MYNENPSQWKIDNEFADKNPYRLYVLSGGHLRHGRPFCA